jgi:hypothetical protein
VQKAHCPRCAGYEDRVMRRADGEELPADVKPCDAFEMSDRFKQWVMDQMRDHVTEQVKASGLDRMVMAKAPKSG